MKQTADIKSFNVISIGDLVVDVVIHIPELPVEAGKHQLAYSVTLEPGGAGNFLIAGRRLGMAMAELGVIGNDLFGRSVQEILKGEGVDLSNLVCQENSTTTTVGALVDDHGKHVFLGTYGHGEKIGFSDAWKSKIRASNAVFTCGYSLQEDRLSDVCLKAIAFAKDNGVVVFFDPGPEMSRATDAMRVEALRSSSVIVMTEEEIPLMTGGDPGEAAVRGLLDKGPDMICVKRGPRGCKLYRRDGEVEHPGYPVVVRDTAAAGDSFDAAFIYGFLRGWPLETVAAFANAMGAAKVKKMGSGRQVPTPVEVQSVLDEFGTSIKNFGTDSTDA